MRRSSSPYEIYSVFGSPRCPEKRHQHTLQAGLVACLGKHVLRELAGIQVAATWIHGLRDNWCGRRIETTQDHVHAYCAEVSFTKMGGEPRWLGTPHKFSVGLEAESAQ